MQLWRRCSRRALLRWTRQYSSIRTPGPETVTIPSGSNGSITLDIHQPMATTPPSTSPTVLIYLPRGPNLHGESLAEPLLPSLIAHLPWPLVRINYRLGQNHKYPTPIHDVLCGYDWIREHLLPKRAITRAGRSAQVGRLAVCGEGIGGGLASMLALTECRLSEPGIVVAAVNNPLVDWVDLETEPKRRQRARRSLESSTPEENPPVHPELSSLRDLLYRRPVHYFDPFASPILFFRSAGVDVPPSKSDVPTDEFDLLELIEKEDFHRQQLALSAITTRPSTSPTDVAQADGKVQRRSSRRYPGTQSGLRLPRFLISAGDIEPFRKQASELAKRLRDSHVRQQKGIAEFGRKVLLDDEFDETDEDEKREMEAHQAEAASKARLDLYTGPSTWDSSPAGQANILNTVTWLKQSLRS